MKEGDRIKKRLSFDLPQPTSMNHSPVNGIAFPTPVMAQDENQQLEACTRRVQTSDC